MNNVIWYRLFHTYFNCGWEKGIQIAIYDSTQLYIATYVCWWLLYQYLMGIIYYWRKLLVTLIILNNLITHSLRYLCLIATHPKELIICMTLACLSKLERTKLTACCWTISILWYYVFWWYGNHTMQEYSRIGCTKFM